MTFWCFLSKLFEYNLSWACWLRMIALLSDLIYHVTIWQYYLIIGKDSNFPFIVIKMCYEPLDSPVLCEEK